MGHHLEFFLRILVGTLLSGLIGYERDIHGRPAGLRTHLIVGLASATFMVVSTQFVYFQSYAKGDPVAVDPSRIAASVVTGVGFLGGGAILRTGASIQGLTTAAGLWLVAAIGLSAGGGMYAESVLVTVIGLAALTVMRRLEGKEDGVLRGKLSLVLTAGATSLASLLDDLRDRGITVSQTEYEKDLARGRVAAGFHIRCPASVTPARLVGIIEAHDGVEVARLDSHP